MLKLQSLAKLDFFPESLVFEGEIEFGLAQTAAGPRLVILAAAEALRDFEGDCSELAGQQLLLGPLTPHNAATLRRRLPWLKPRRLGLQTSAGMGDRLGLATPGHVQAMREAGGGIAPIFAQQSIREMSRTGRTPQQVMDAATWGVFQEGWRDGVGADADHLKTTADLDSCVAAGFTFFTIDPGEHVDNRAETATLSELRAAADRLPPEVQPRATSLLGKTFAVESASIHFDEPTLFRAAVKYGRAVAHVAMMYQHLLGSVETEDWELEVSVDETEQPTSHAEHLYIATELKRLGVRWVSMAPRYVGRFEKGVDYIGDLDALESDLAVHAAIARDFGPYKLSLHSGSDKFSLYPIAMRQTRGLVHLKTAGTSYLEALRTIATLDPEFFRSLYAFARERYETDQASYHVSAQLSRAPLPNDLGDTHLPELLEHFDARQILHVTFGSVLTDRQHRFQERFMILLQEHARAYTAHVKAHFVRHLKPFATA